MIRAVYLVCTEWTPNWNDQDYLNLGGSFRSRPAALTSPSRTHPAAFVFLSSPMDQADEQPEMIIPNVMASVKIQYSSQDAAVKFHFIPY